MKLLKCSESAETFGQGRLAEGYAAFSGGAQRWASFQTYLRKKKHVVCDLTCSVKNKCLG